MQKFSHTVYIECPPQQAFDFLLDLRNDTKWWRQLHFTEKTSLGDVGEGTTYHQVSGVLFVSIHSDVVVSDVNPPFWFRLTNQSPQLNYKVKYEIEPIDQGCNVTMIAQIEANGLLDRLLPLTVKVTKRQLANNFKNLKSILEDSATLDPVSAPV